MLENKRYCGVLLPISSLPSKYGIGSLGKASYEFIDFLNDAGQHYWQVLPVGPTGYGDSPYQSFSAFASNPYFIDLDLLVDEGLLEAREIDEAEFSDENNIDYYDLYLKRVPVLTKACNRIETHNNDYMKYVENNKYWIDDYALFMALKVDNNMKPLWEWPEPIRKRNEETLQKLQKRLNSEIDFWKKVQFIFHKQWMKMKAYAEEKNVAIIGDLPIYVSEDSAELWSCPELFQTDEDGRPKNVAGCPPDFFSPEGQLWGNPIYNWEYQKSKEYHWWIKRLEYWGCFFNCIRIDHFRGFSGYYSIPRGNINAVDGEWKTGPGKEFISVLKDKLADLPIIAEDLGFLTQDVIDLLEFSGYPGMKVLQFAFSSDSSNVYLPHNYNKNCVVYTGTHDNDTTSSWAESASDVEISFALKYLGIKEREQLTEMMIRAAYESVADTVIIPMQDWLKLGNKARINTPSTLGGNWIWRLTKESLTDELKEAMRETAGLYCRS